MDGVVGGGMDGVVGEGLNGCVGGGMDWRVGGGMNRFVGGFVFWWGLLFRRCSFTLPDKSNQFWFHADRISVCDLYLRRSDFTLD